MRVDDDCVHQDETTRSMGSVYRAADYRVLLDEGNHSGSSMRELAMRHGVSSHSRIAAMAQAFPRWPTARMRG